MEGSTCCGICLSENGKAVRGEIDSCEHYFCFVCIMEWAKVESRCPMCKRRFSSIRRPPKPGVFLHQRILNVPLRDQVYHISGNASVGHFDPYGQVSCSVCNTDVDDSLLLLCDLCDCASHTYCVGLGATVPEGDWFCEDCAVSRTEHENVELDGNDNGEDALAKLKAEPKVCVETAVQEQNFVETSDARVEAESNVLIFDIVGEMDDRRQSRRFSAPAGAFGIGSRPVIAEELTTAPDSRTSQTEYGERRSQSLNVMAQTNTRTLGRCRNVHGRIRVLRENWNSLQSGTSTFSSVSVESGARNGGNGNTLGGSHDAVQDGSTSTTRQDGCLDDVDKAWKMMDRAKSIQKPFKNNQKVSPASKCIPVKENAFKSSMASLHLLERHQGGTSFESTANMKHPKRFSLEKEDEKHVSSYLEKHKRARVSSNEDVGSNQGLPEACAPEASTSLCALEERSSSSQRGVYHNNCLHKRARVSSNEDAGSNQGLPEACAPEASTSLCTLDERSSSSQRGVYHNNCLTSVQKKPSKAALSVSNNENHRFSKSEMMSSSSKGEVETKVTSVEREPRRDDDTKREIQSLVKLNLKLLSRDKKLEVEAFKRIARLSTHTILAAYGFEHSRHVSCSFKKPICSHSESTHQLGKSSLMLKSCQECFRAFVKNVVHSTLSDRVSHVKPR